MGNVKCIGGIRRFILEVTLVATYAANPQWKASE